MIGDVTTQADFLPEGPKAGSDLSMIRTGVVKELDKVGKRVRVAYNGGSGIWLAAMPNRYIVGRTCFVMCNPLMGGRGELAMGPVDGAAQWASQKVTLTSMDTNARTAVVTVGGESFTVPYVQAVYTVGTSVWALCNPSLWGEPELVLGPWAPPVPPAEPDAPDPIATPGEGATTQQVTVTIQPQWSGTYRVSRSAWDRWNTDAFGGRSDVYQGNAYGSGTLIGLATYGDQLVNLNAISIDAVTVNIVHNGGSGMPGPVVLQGASNGSQPAGAPSTFGATSGNVLSSGTREDLRTGAAKGLALVGTGYYGARGTSGPPGMSMSVTYTRSA